MGLFGRSRSGEDRSEQGTLNGVAVPTVPSDTDIRVPVVDTTDPAEQVDPELFEHLDRLTAAADGDVERLTPEEFDAALTSRLVSAERVHETGLGFSYAIPFTQGVHEVLSLDLPTAVVMLPDSRVTETGHRVGAMFERGRQNLTTLAVSAPVDVERVGDRGGSVHAFVGDSPYTASFGRFLDLMVRRLLPKADHHGGFIFAMPYRHALLVQPCSSPAMTRDGLELVPAYAQALFADGAGPVSPHTYHWLDRTITCLTHERPDGTLDVRTTPVLEQLLGHRRHAG